MTLKSRLLAVVAMVALSGCMAGGEDVVQQTSRQVAKQVVNGVIAQKFPGVNAAPYSDCIIDNASAAEIINIAKFAATGANQATTDLVLQIASRPDTSNCIAQNALGNILG